MYAIDCLNVDEKWCKDFAKYTYTQAEGSAQDKEDIEYQLVASDYDEMPSLSSDGKSISISREVLHHSFDKD